MAQEKKKPLHVVRFGNIRAAIWSNRNGKDEEWYSVTIMRRYRDGEVWKNATSFSHEDLPVVRNVPDVAYSWLCSHRAGADEEEELGAYRIDDPCA